MPHQCTGCGHVFPDGSKEMLSGCPDCGGNKFQFQPDGQRGGADADAAANDDAAARTEQPEPPEPPGPSGGVADTVAGATERVRDLVSSDDAAGDDAAWPAVGREDERSDATAPSASEDTAQASARSGVVEPDELPEHEPAEEPPAAPASASAAPETDPGSAPFTGSGDREQSADDGPGLEDLRAELNDQFESIKIVERGQYELNLMELYDREEYIISLMEDGRYAIEVPETWRGE